MELRKDGLLYKIAYFFHKEEEYPNKANTCRFFWRVIFMSVTVPVFAIFVYIIICCVFFIGFFFAARPTVFKSDSKVEVMVLYKKWPTVYEHRIMPIILVCIAGAGWLSFTYSAEIMSNLFALSNTAMTLFSRAFSESVFLWTMGAVVTLTFFIYKMRKFRGTGAHKLLKEYIRAKKERFCPIVHFVK